MNFLSLVYANHIKPLCRRSHGLLAPISTQQTAYFINITSSTGRPTNTANFHYSHIMLQHPERMVSILKWFLHSLCMWKFFFLVCLFFHIVKCGAPHHFPVELPGILSLVLLILDNVGYLTKLVLIERLRKTCHEAFDEFSPWFLMMWSEIMYKRLFWSQ